MDTKSAVLQFCFYRIIEMASGSETMHSKHLILYTSVMVACERPEKQLVVRWDTHSHTHSGETDTHTCGSQARNSLSPRRPGAEASFFPSNQLSKPGNSWAGVAGVRGQNVSLDTSHYCLHFQFRTNSGKPKLSPSRQSRGALLAGLPSQHPAPTDPGGTPRPPPMGRLPPTAAHGELRQLQGSSTHGSSGPFADPHSTGLNSPLAPPALPKLSPESHCLEKQNMGGFPR